MTKFCNKTKTTKGLEYTNSNLLLALHTQFRALRFVTQTHICLRDAYAKQIFSTELSRVKFIYSEKATKIFEISILDLTVTT